MGYKSLFFDLDDTLWDTQYNNKECLKEIYIDYKFARHYESFEAFYNIYMPHNLKLWAHYRKHEIDRKTLILERFLHILRPMGIDDEDYTLKLNHDFLQRTTTKTKLIPGAIDLLKYLRPYYRMFILSNGFREIQSLKMENSGLSPYFEKIILSEDANIQKPHKGIFDFALTTTNSRRKESIMIGDSWEADIEGAFQSKIDQIWFNPDKLEHKKFHATYQVNTLLQIKDIL
ncbi:MAG: YjjG family noncanonical pyrimidine nucleotidase [Tannerella sp.]|nr:YjjG family noncanonical pyrimidine nucleotidase [Tannerella sp.]